MRCRICKENEATLSWQPFGPDDARSNMAFTFMGHHCRGFPVIKVCEGCQRRILDYEEVVFEYKSERYFLITDVPLSTFGKELYCLAVRLQRLYGEVIFQQSSSYVVLLDSARYLMELSRKVR